MTQVYVASKHNEKIYICATLSYILHVHRIAFSYWLRAITGHTIVHYVVTLWHILSQIITIIKTNL